MGTAGDNFRNILCILSKTPIRFLQYLIFSYFFNRFIYYLFIIYLLCIYLVIIQMFGILYIFCIFLYTQPPSQASVVRLPIYINFLSLHWRRRISQILGASSCTSVAIATSSTLAARNAPNVETRSSRESALQDASCFAERRPYFAEKHPFTICVF